MSWIYFILIFLVSDAVEYLISKKILSNDSSIVFSFLRSLYGFIFVLILFPFINLNIGIKNILIIYLISLIGGVGVYYRTKSIKKLQISYVAPMLNFMSPLVFIFAVLFLKESIGLIQVIGIIVLTISLYILNLSDESSIFSILKSFVADKKYLVLVPILLFSITSVLDKFILSSVEPFVFMFYITLFLALNFFIMILVKGRLIRLRDSIKNYKFYLIIGLLLFLSQIGQYFAKSLKEVSVVTPMLMMSSVIVIVLSKKFFNEDNILRKAFASVILIVGIFLLLL